MKEPYINYFRLIEKELFKPKDKVIFNPPATILIKDGKKYVSIAKDEPFDEEKGLALCLLKSKGVSYRELREMIEKNKWRKYEK